jgi:hypothetical protein
VVAEDPEDRGLEPRELRDELIEKHLRVADEVSRDHDQVGRLRVREIDRRTLHGERRHAAEMEVCQVRDPEVGELLGVPCAATEASELDRRRLGGDPRREVAQMHGGGSLRTPTSRASRPLGPSTTSREDH